MSKKLYIGGIPFNTRQETLRNTFAQAGNVQYASIIIDRETRKSRGFGFVEMSNSEEAQKAIAMFDGFELEGRKLMVKEALPKSDKPFKKENTPSHRLFEKFEEAASEAAE